MQKIQKFQFGRLYTAPKSTKTYELLDRSGHHLTFRVWNPLFEFPNTLQVFKKKVRYYITWGYRKPSQVTVNQRLARVFSIFSGTLVEQILF